MNRGIFAVVKPVGITSAGVTNRIKRIITRKSKLDSPPKVKVGHGGTLDRDATGVLVIAIGQDCKKLENYLRSNKSYECVGKLGEATDTFDVSGQIVEEADWKHVEVSDISTALKDHFCGEMVQLPPTYSAIKHGGRRASDMAREGIAVPLSPRKVTVHSISLIDFQPPFFKIHVHCSSGTYIRTIIHDLGKALGSAAHVRELCRTEQGPFTLTHALPEEDWTSDGIQKSIEKSSHII